MVEVHKVEAETIDGDGAIRSARREEKTSFVASISARRMRHEVDCFVRFRYEILNCAQWIKYEAKSKRKKKLRTLIPCILTKSCVRKHIRSNDQQVTH